MTSSFFRGLAFGASISVVLWILIFTLVLP